MFHRKNVPDWERALRVTAGIGLIAGGLLGLGVTPLGIAVAVLGVVALVTGSVGVCPVCAVAGRGPVGEDPRREDRKEGGR